MTKRLQQVRRHRGEAGSALVMALLFLTLFGVLTASLLSFGFVGQKATEVVRGSRDQRYAADGAVDGAIQRYRKMSDAGNTNPCGSGDPFFTYTVRDKTATASCTGSSIGGTPNPSQSLLPSSVTSEHFQPYNTSTSKTLFETLQHNESAIVPGYGGGLPSGTTAFTTYPQASPNANKVSFNYAGVNPIVGDSFPQVLAIVSHREGTGPGNAPAQDQWLTITTKDSSAGPVINCNANGTKYSVRDAKASSGPAWPIPPYQTIDVTRIPAVGGGTSASSCLNSRVRVENATITYNATCGPRTVAATRVAPNTVNSPTAGFSDGDINSPISGGGIPAATVITAITSPTSATVSKTVTNGSGNVTIGTAGNCGSNQDFLDTVTLCLCLRSVPSVAVATPVCQEPATSSGRDFWVITGGAAANKDCTQGHQPLNVGQPATPDTGLFQPLEPSLVGRSACGSDGVQCPAASHARWGNADLNASKSLALSGWSWPAIGPVTFMTLRVSHLEERPNLVPYVSISFDGSNCPTPIEIGLSTSGFTEYAQFLPTGCAPNTQHKMETLTLTYTVACQASYLGTTYPTCGGGGNSTPDAFLDAIVFDLEYELGGSGGTPVASFVATSGSTTVSANATFGDDVEVSQYQVN